MSLEHFQSSILPLVLSSQCFGENAELISVTENSAKVKDQFQSIIRFLELKVAVGGIRVNFQLVCKFPIENSEIRKLFKTDWQFFNELLVYDKILPLFPESAQNLFPKFYYGTSTLSKLPKEDVIIIQSLTSFGFKQSYERLFLDYNHCSLVFRKLGEFHGESFKLKTISPSTLLNNTKQLIETRYYQENKQILNSFFGETAKRGVIPMVRNGEHLPLLTCFMKKLDDVFALMKELLKTTKLSVFCHGDFCRNNMMFKYEDGKPVDVKFYDLATARFASPMVDISFFLFLNINMELRRKYLKEDFMIIYQEGFQSVAGSLAPSMSELWTEFQRAAVYGYIVTAFFLPVMMSNKDSKDMEAEMLLSFEERLKFFLTSGGEPLTNKLTDMVRDLIDWQCL